MMMGMKMPEVMEVPKVHEVHIPKAAAISQHDCHRGTQQITGLRLFLLPLSRESPLVGRMIANGVQHNIYDTR